MTDDSLRSRLRLARKKWEMTATDLSDRSGVDFATIQRVEVGQFEADRLAVWKLALALHVYPELLRWDDLPMVPVWEMTVPAQHAALTGPGSESLPGYVVIDPGGAVVPGRRRRMASRLNRLVGKGQDWTQRHYC